MANAPNEVSKTNPNEVQQAKTILHEIAALKAKLDDLDEQSGIIQKAYRLGFHRHNVPDDKEEASARAHLSPMLLEWVPEMLELFHRLVSLTAAKDALFSLLTSPPNSTR